MSDDGRGTSKRAWKAFQVEYDFVFGVSERYCSYCLNDQQVAALLSMVEYLKWPTRWVKASGEIDRDIIEAFSDGLAYRLMSGCCDDNLPIQYRYSPSGVLQRSLNGGNTWEDAPLYDPRVYSPQFPPVDGADSDDKKCIAATGAAALVKQEVGDQLTDDMSRYTLNQLITDWVGTMIQTSNPFEALLRVIANQIFALVISVLRPALTSTVYDTFQCILYCRMADDASFNDGQWTGVRSDITDQIGGIAGIFLEHLVYLLGTGGLTNLVRSGGATSGDCTDCVCPGCNPDNWSIFVGAANGNSYGIEISRTDNEIVVQAEFDPYVTGGWFIAMTTGTPEQCCTIRAEKVIDNGPHNFSYAIPCGDAIPADIVSWPGTGAIDEILDKNTFAMSCSPSEQVRFIFT